MGNVFLILAWLFCITSIISGFYYSRAANKPLAFTFVRSGTILVCAALLASLISLGISFLTNDYSLQYVWQYSNIDMDSIYKFTAIWGGMDGSMLLWCVLLSVSGAIAAFNSIKQPNRELMANTLAVINTATLFFTTVTVYLTNPFRYIKAAFIPPDGNGLNPLLQNPYMAIHPPMLYLGFTTFAIPYAFCMGALLAKDESHSWIKLTRSWTLVAWGFLTIGIFLGGHWAYLELGWGGFWAWDPVENSSFLPWLTGTAFLHSVMVQERKGLLKGWNVWLIVITYALTVFGTFLTRSGIVQSIHAFAATNVGWIFLVYLALIFASTVYLTISKQEILKPEKSVVSFFSRETAFLINNLIFLSICFSILWGVMFPVFSEYVTGEKQTVGIPYFNAVNIPLFLALILLMGIGPMIAWRDNSWDKLVKTFAGPLVFTLVAGALLILCGITDFYPVLSYCLSMFVILTLIKEIYRTYRRNKPAAAARDDQAKIDLNSSVLFKNQLRFGGYIVHFGVAIVTIAITASMAHKIEREFTLAVGESYEAGKFKVELTALNERETKNYLALAADLAVYDRKSNTLITRLSPELRHYTRNDESTTEVALKMRPLEDIYLIVAGIDETGTKAALKLYINPLQVWLWIGGLIMVAGTILVLIPRRLTGN